MPTVLIVEDEDTQRIMIGSLIKKRFGYDVIDAEDGKQALNIVKRQMPDVVIMDVHMPKKDGLETLSELSERYPDLPVIMLTSSDEIDHAVRAMKMGAIDFLPKPAEPERLAVSILHVLKMRAMSRELHRYKRKESGETQFSDMIGYDSGLKSLVKIARRGAQSDLPILITGETGVGKEVLARAIHGESIRCCHPFIAINCAAIPAQLVESTLFGHVKGSFTGAITDALGKFREAEGGTLFLDEIGELPLDVQAKLLRVLQEKEVEPVGAGKSVPVNVRIISATHRTLKDEVSSGHFREDLFFRLNVLPLHIPTLHERVQDIPAFITFFMERFVAHYDIPMKEISTHAIDVLCNHSWPGNIRELENTIQRIMVTSEHSMIGAEDVQAVMMHYTHTPDSPYALTDNGTLPFVQTDGSLLPLKAIEEQAIRFALSHHNGNVTQAAKSLGMAKPTLYRRLSELKIKDV